MSKYAYFSFKENGTNTNGGVEPPRICSDGLNYPFSVVVLPPSSAWSSNGEIFNRYYEMQSGVFVETKKLTAENISQNMGDSVKIWMDDASALATICLEDNGSWRGLAYVPSDYSLVDYSIPEKTVDEILKLVRQQTRIPTEIINLSFVQVQTFLKNVEMEIGQDLDIQGIRDLCAVEYSVKTQISPYGGDWDSSSGMFGRKGDSQFSGIYNQCLENLNNHLIDEFSRDFMGYDVNPNLVV